jgi:hypothetical protein
MIRAAGPVVAVLTAALAAAVASSQGPAPPGPAVIHPDETHFANIRQLTFGGQNAEGETNLFVVDWVD